MNLLEVISQVRSFLEQNGRVSYRVLRRQFELDDETLEELKEELIDVQQVAVDEVVGYSRGLMASSRMTVRTPPYRRKPQHPSATSPPTPQSTWRSGS